MKVILALTAIVAIVMCAGIGSLMIIGIIGAAQGMDYILKALAVIVLLGGSSALVALVTGKQQDARED